VTGAYTWSAAFAVRAAALASRHALLVLVQAISGSASADARRHALAASASVGADRLTLAVDFVVAQFAHAYLGGEAIGVLMTLVRAYGLADAVLGAPSRRAAADVRSCAATAETAEIAVRLAQAARHVALIAVATVQDGNQTIVMLKNSFHLTF